MKYEVIGYGKYGVKSIDSTETLLDAISVSANLPKLFQAIGIFEQNANYPTLMVRDGEELCFCKGNYASNATIL